MVSGRTRRGVAVRSLRLGRIGAAVAQAVAVAFLVLVVVFVLVRLVPGNPATGILGAHATRQAVAALNAQLHLNEPLLSQFASYLSDLLHGNLGTSLVSGRPVTAIIGSALPITLAVVAGSVLLSVVIGIPLGIVAATTRRGHVDVAVRGVSTVLLATPTFFIGLLLILGFGLGTGWFPVGGWAGSYPANFRFLVLPCLALSCYLTPFIVRVVRQAAVEAGKQPFIEAAIARGLPRRVVITRHILPNSLLPVVTLVGLNIGALLAGAVVIEAVFNLPGVGTQLLQAVSARDYPVIQGVAITTAVIVVCANLLTDVVYGLVDPRTRRPR
jgi:peptide/nickel transport system permease protein